MSVDVQPRPCTACHALVYDLKYAKTGNLAPIDAEANPRGNIEVNLVEGTYIIVGRDTVAEKHMNHFATCPAANKFRKQKEVTNAAGG